MAKVPEKIKDNSRKGGTTVIDNRPATKPAAEDKKEDQKSRG